MFIDPHCGPSSSILLAASSQASLRLGSHSVGLGYWIPHGGPTESTKQMGAVTTITKNAVSKKNFVVQLGKCTFLNSVTQMLIASMISVRDYASSKHNDYLAYCEFCHGIKQ